MWRGDTGRTPSPDAHALLDVCGRHLVPEPHHKLRGTAHAGHPCHSRRFADLLLMVDAYVARETQTGALVQILCQLAFAICLTLIRYFASSVPGLMILVHLATCTTGPALRARSWTRAAAHGDCSQSTGLAAAGCPGPDPSTGRHPLGRQLTFDWKRDGDMERPQRLLCSHLQRLLLLHGLLVGHQVPPAGRRQACVRLLDARDFVDALRNVLHAFME